jgi:hypothetical protein
MASSSIGALVATGSLQPKPGSSFVEDHPQLSYNKHPVDGALVGVGSLWPYFPTR